MQISSLLKHKLIILGLIINISFYVSSLSGKWYDFFFFGSSIHHCCQGLDFYQIPNGVYAFFKGGDLSGKLALDIKPYSQKYFSNLNVYHPLLTLILGSFFILFNPNTSFHLWMLIKLIVSFAIIFYFYKNYKKHRYIDLAIFFLLINFSQYNEIRISQYQFIFNYSLLLFLIFLDKDNDTLEAGLAYFITLIAKPIGLLWAPVLFLRRKFYSASLGLALFLFSTGIFQILGIGNYFTKNVVSHFINPIKTNTIDIMSLDALLRYTFHTDNLSLIKYAILGIIFLLTLNKKTSTTKIIFLLSIYFLFFYDLLYQYHFSILGPILSFCLLTLKDFQSRLAITLIALINLPGVFFILRLFNVGVYNNNFLGTDPTFFGWQIVSFFQLLPLLLLTIIVIIPEFKLLLKYDKR